MLDDPEYVGLTESCGDPLLSIYLENRLSTQENHVPSLAQGVADTETRPPASFTML